MNMKDHILSALSEEFDSWEELLASLSEEQVTTPHFDFDWSCQHRGEMSTNHRFKKSTFKR
jgi:hypothetical protein